MKKVVTSHLPGIVQYYPPWRQEGELWNSLAACGVYNGVNTQVARTLHMQ